MASQRRSARGLKRARNGDFTVSYEEARGKWYTRVGLGRDENGREIRRTVRGDSPQEVADKARELQKQGTDHGPKDAAARRSGTVEDWMTDWLAGIKLTRKASTYNFYEYLCRLYLIPGIGSMKLADLTPERIEKLLFTLTTVSQGKAGSPARVSPTIRKGCHRTLRACLGVAHERGYLPTNPASHVKVPMPPAEEIRPLTRAEVLAVIDAARVADMPARWLVALMLGVRQGEALGLRFSDIALDSDPPIISIVQNRVRQRWEHGCTTPKTCGKPSTCPKRHRNGPFDTTKTTNGTRKIPIPPSLVPALRQQKTIVAKMRLKAGPDWTDNDLVFPGPHGAPMDNRSDARAWKRLLARAGVPPARLHDARHTAASMQLYLGTDLKSLATQFGWGADAAKMADRYQHVIQDLQVDSMRKLDTFLFGE